MQPTPSPSNVAEPLPFTPAAERSDRFIYIACPWSPAGGGMYKVGDYLVQSQADEIPANAARLKPLDTRGPGSAWASFWVLLVSLARILQGRFNGRLAGVHVNMAERLSLFRKGTIVAFCHLVGVPVVIHLHAQMQRFYRSLPSPLRALTRWMFSLADTVVVIGSGPRKFVIEDLQVPARDVEIVMNGVPGPTLARSRVHSSRKHAVFVGRLCEPKGVSDLLNAVARAGFDAKDVQVTIAGGGDIAHYENKAKELGIDEVVEFAGWCEQPEVDALLARADLLVLPSHDEVMPLVVLEALANGVPVLCTPVGELPMILTDGENACFVPVADVNALADALKNLLKGEEILAELGRNGRELYERQFSMEHFFANVARVHRKHFGVAGHLAGATTIAPGAAMHAGTETTR